MKNSELKQIIREMVEEEVQNSSKLNKLLEQFAALKLSDAEIEQVTEIVENDMVEDDEVHGKLNKAITIASMIFSLISLTGEKNVDLGELLEKHQTPIEQTASHGKEHDTKKQEKALAYASKFSSQRERDELAAHRDISQLGKIQEASKSYEEEVELDIADQILDEVINQSVVKNSSRIAKGSKEYNQYHKSYTSAVNAAKDYATLNKYLLSPDDLATSVGFNSKRPTGDRPTKVDLKIFPIEKFLMALQSPEGRDTSKGIINNIIEYSSRPISNAKDLDEDDLEEIQGHLLDGLIDDGIIKQSKKYLHYTVSYLGDHGNSPYELVTYIQ